MARQKIAQMVDDTTEAPNIAAPVDIIVRFWQDRSPEVMCDSLAPWLVSATLAEATDLVNDLIAGEKEEP